MANDGQIVFEVTADGSRAKADIKDITKSIQNESKNWDKAVQESTDKMGDSFSGLLKKLTLAGIGAGIVNGLKNIASAAIETASDLQEVQNVVDTTFGGNANQIEKWAKSAGEQFGLTELQAKKFTSTMGAMLKSSGMADNEIVQISTDLSGLAADMASFYNLDFEEAFAKIRSGISGQTMPLKELGIDMSVATLNAFALSKGMEKTFDKMSQGEQTMLRYQYLMSATADAQGDFAKTADGYANSQRRIQTSLNTISASVGGFLMGFIEPAVSGVADLLTKLTSTPERTIFDDFNDIEVDTADKMADLEATYSKAQDIINLLKEIGEQTITLKDGSTKTFEELFQDIGNVEKNGGDVRGYLESLGVDVDFVIQKYNVWKEATRQLTNTVPALADAIDEETGAINGGTDALQKNLDEWRAYQEKKLAWAAYYAKEQALAERKASLYLIEFDAGAARQAAQKAREALTNIYGAVFDEEGRIIERFDAERKNKYESGGYDVSQVEADFEHYKILLEKEQQTKQDLANTTVDLTDAERDLANGKEELIKKYGEEEKAAEASATATLSWSESTKEGAKTAIDAVNSSLTALGDYVQKVKDSVESSVNSIIKGFDKVSKAGDELRKKQAELGGQASDVIHDSKYEDVWKKWGSSDESLKAMEAFVKNGGKLTDVEKEAYEALVKVRNAQIELNKSLEEYSPQTMKNNLQSQIEYMNEYIANLKKAQSYGLSAEFLASLSDGSTESAEYLSQLVSAWESGDEQIVKDVDAKYQEVQEKGKEFTDTLTETQLKADETYQSLYKDAEEAVANLGLLPGAAGENAKAIVDSIAQGVSDNLPEVKTAVDDILAQLDRLAGLAVSFTFGVTSTAPTGYVPPTGSGGGGKVIDGEFETGLDRVPFTGFLASLHEGEGILTAEENRIWQRFKNGESSIDYDTMGGVMRDNIKPGGNVYLDGRVVGSVISDQQGKSFRQLQRSGWQS